MSYSTPANLKKSLIIEYWKQARKKLDEDGWAYTLDPNVFTDEEDFLQSFLDRSCDFVEAYLSGGVAGNPPYASSGVLETIERWLSVYDVEQYVLSGTTDRVISVSINEDKKRALMMLDKINEGKLSGVVPLVPPDAESNAAPSLIEPCGDGDPLSFDGIEENVFLSTPEDTSCYAEDS